MLRTLNSILFVSVLALHSTATIATTPSTTDLVAPEITVAGDTLRWDNTGAVTINVHSGDGDWLESLNGNATSWQASAPGEYFLVSTDHGRWQDWAKSEIVLVENTEAFLDTTDTHTITTHYSIAPQMVDAVVYGEHSAEISWPGVANPDSITHYQVIRDDVLLHTTTGHSFFIEFLEPGTQYSYLVNAVRFDGTTTDGTSVTFTTAGRSPAEGFGKPIIANDNYSFYLWDFMPVSAQNLYRSDCRFALNIGRGNMVCFSPSTRELMSVRPGYGAPSEELWNVVIPGENNSHQIEGILWTSINHFATVADNTPFFTDPAYEISQYEVNFQVNAELIGTLPILESFSDTGSNSHRLINIDGKDLMIRLGQFSGIPGRADTVNQIDVYAEYYEAIVGSDLSQKSSWENKGAFIAKIDGQTGSTVDIAFHEGISAEALYERIQNAFR